MFQTKLHIDLDWMKQLSLSLKRFRKVKDRVYVCRCPFCGDSKKSSAKARFYFYVKQGMLNVDCKNCGYSSSFFNFVKKFSPEQFDAYKKETLLSSFTQPKKPTDSPLLNDTKPQFKIEKTVSDQIFDYLTPINKLDKSHVAIQYLYNRGFRESQCKLLFYTENFKEVARVFDAGAAKNLREKEPRIIIPFYDETGVCVAFQGRSLDPESKLKYITIKQNDDVEKVYGLERIDHSNTIYCVEGPLDSLFVENCLATCDANLLSCKIADVYIWDNEPRNPDIVKYMKTAIDKGYKLVVWPTSPDRKIDINEMIQSGVSEEMLMRIIKKCTVKGLKAKVEFNKWKKV